MRFNGFQRRKAAQRPVVAFHPGMEKFLLAKNGVTIAVEFHEGHHAVADDEAERIFPFFQVQRAVCYGQQVAQISIVQLEYLLDGRQLIFGDTPLYDLILFCKLNCLHTEDGLEGAQLIAGRFPRQNAAFVLFFLAVFTSAG